MIVRWFVNVWKGKVVFSFPDAIRCLDTPTFQLRPSQLARGASIDTRTLVPGDLFVALQGRHADGHDFLEEAFRKGAAGALIRKDVFRSRESYFLSKPKYYFNLLPVSDPERAMVKLAQWQREQFRFPVIAVTGSVGKTTTKEFLYYLMSRSAAGISNTGSENNHLGVPLTLLRLDRALKFCVCEIGASHRSEIGYLASLLKPTSGILTPIAPAHLEGFGSLEGVYEGKLELLDSLPADSSIVISDDDALLLRKVQRFKLKVILIGFSKKADFRISHVRWEKGRVWFRVNDSRTFCLAVAAPFFVLNATMAIAMAEVHGLAMKHMPEDWDDAGLSPGRFRERMLGSNLRVIDDSYNANPLSFRQALGAMEDFEVRGRKLLVFSDMLELGSFAEKYHVELGAQIARLALDGVFAYGPLAKKCLVELQRLRPLSLVKHFDSPLETAQFLTEYLRPFDTVLLKGSRSMGVDQVLKYLEKAQGATVTK